MISADNKPKTYLISRHYGAIQWMHINGIAFDCHREHLNPHEIDPGDTVIGTLPINLAAEVCERGARYLHLSLKLPCDARGRELSASELNDYGSDPSGVVPSTPDGMKYRQGQAV